MTRITPPMLPPPMIGVQVIRQRIDFPRRLVASIAINRRSLYVQTARWNSPESRQHWVAA